MLKIIVLIFSTLIPKLALSQCDVLFMPKEIIADSTIYVNGKNFKGYIFPSDYHGFILNKKLNSIWLTESQIIQIEKIFIEQYNTLLKNDPQVSSEIEIKKDPKKQYKKHHRQYLGYVCENGDLCALMLLLKKTVKLREQFECFDKVMALGFGEIYEKNQILVNINISKSKLIRP